MPIISHSMFMYKNKKTHSVYKNIFDKENYIQLIRSLRNVNEHKLEKFFSNLLEIEDLSILSRDESFLYRIYFDDDYVIGFDYFKNYQDPEAETIEIKFCKTNAGIIDTEEFLNSCPKVYRDILLFNLDLIT